MHQLLAEKFSLFEGVFGASDEVLGAIGSGVDFERRVAEIYQCCRHAAEITAAFDALQAELAPEIDAEITETRTKILEHFDDEVRERLKATDADTHAVLDRFERDLMRLTAIELGEDASWHSLDRFDLLRQPSWGPDIPLGAYLGPRTNGVGHIYRPAHPLAQAAVQRASSRELAAAELTFNLTGHPGKISALERFLGGSGWASVEMLSVEAGGEPHPLAATLALRAMIDFTLTTARSKRYGYAAEHLSTCAELAGRIEDCGELETHDAYLVQLKSQHGRKYGFWFLTEA